MTAPTAGAAAPVLIVGTGLMGASLGLALTAAGQPVLLTDRDPEASRLAADLGAGQVWTGDEPTPPGVVVLAVPPSAVGAEVARWQQRYDTATVTDVASVKAAVADAVDAAGADPRRFVGGHPVAGREVAGALGAQADLFEARPWVLTPGEADPDRVDAIEALVRTVGALPVRMSAQRHDAAMALVSHGPQVAASLTAAVLADADGELVALSGQGLRDTTRIAAGDPQLWTDILSGNTAAVLDVLDGLADRLDRMRDALRAGRTDEVGSLLAEGVAGRRRIPGKHGGSAAAYTTVTVIVADAPGALAAILAGADEAGVNVEDLRIEHAPAQPVGLVELSVRPDSADTLVVALRDRGWRVHA